MNTLRVILTEAFIRHPAGLVFELSEATGASGWEDDDRLREKLNFSDKRTYHLPDGGNGAACELPVSKTMVCPPTVFKNEDLCCGPCRVTGAQIVDGEATHDSDLKYTIQLLELNGQNAQGLVLPLAHWESPPQGIRLNDRRRETMMQDIPVDIFQSGVLDFSDLLPGFYRLDIQMSSVLLYQVSFIKSFPLLVNIQRNGNFTTQKTLY